MEGAQCPSIYKSCTGICCHTSVSWQHKYSNLYLILAYLVYTFFVIFHLIAQKGVVRVSGHYLIGCFHTKCQMWTCSIIHMNGIVYGSTCGNKIKFSIIEEPTIFFTVLFIRSAKALCNGSPVCVILICILLYFNEFT